MQAPQLHHQKNKVNDRERIELKKYCRWDRSTRSTRRPGIDGVTVPSLRVGRPMHDGLTSWWLAARTATVGLRRWCERRTPTPTRWRTGSPATRRMRGTWCRRPTSGPTGASAVPGRRAVHDLAVPDHRQLRRHPPRPAAPATATTSSTTTRRWSTTGPSRSRRPRPTPATLRDRLRGRHRRAAAPAAGGRRAPRRLRPAPRGHRRRARHLRVGGQGAAAPGPAQAAGAAVPLPGRPTTVEEDDARAV